jgi:predicted nucleic acid-binding protein
MTANIVVFDTSVLIDYLRTGRHEQQIDSIRGVIRNTSVVLAELWRGATRVQERKFIETLARNHPILIPTESNWRDSGQILGKISVQKGFSSDKLRDLHFDVLIALTARSHGARLITSNRAGFELISSYKKLQLEIW